MDFRAGGKALQLIRKKRGLTQEKLAELAGVTSNTVSRIECGALFPALDTLVELCNALHTSADSVLAPYIQADADVQWSPLAEKLGALPQEKQNKIVAILDFMIDTL